MMLEDKINKLKENKIYQMLEDFDADIYLVGGIIRDLLLNKPVCDIHDFDIIVTDVPAKDFAQCIPDKTDVAAVITLDEVNNIYRVVMPDKVNYIDITNPINGSLEDDLKRRDITINSVAFNIRTKKFVDINGGLNDLSNRIIRAVSEENIIEDPLRIIRIYRFASVLGFNIENKTESLLKKHVKLISLPAIERINAEILKLFGGEYAHSVIELMDKIGLVDILFSIMVDVKKVPPNTHHHLDLFHHSIETVYQIQKIYENSSDEVKSHLEQVDFGGDTRLAHLKLSGFLHDIGKFSTWTIESDGRHRFINHDEKGADLAKTILKNKKFSKKQIEYISFMIRNHIYPSSVVSSKNINDKIYMRYIRKTQENAIDLIVLAKADRLSARGVLVSDKMVEENISNLDKLQSYYLRVKPLLKPIPKLLDGNEIMNLLNISPSKTLGIIMEALKNAQLDDIVMTKEDAIKFVTEFKNNNSDL